MLDSITTGADPTRSTAAPASPALACVVLSFEDEPGLVAAVRSVLEQSEPVEVVVVNSGGGDPAGRLNAAGLSRVPVYSRAERLYPGAVRNIGITVTSAPYVAFLAADCVAGDGWAAGRLAAHRAGAAAVASAVTNAYPESIPAWAGHLLLHNRLHETTPRARRLRYLLSYDRRLFGRHGSFREDLRASEDTELNARLEAAGEVVATPARLSTAHRYPTTTRAFLRDSFRRGRLHAAMTGLLSDGPANGPRSLRVVASLPGTTASMLRCVAGSRQPERGRLVRALPLAWLGVGSYAAGALTASRSADDVGRTARVSGPRTPRRSLPRSGRRDSLAARGADAAASRPHP